MDALHAEIINILILVITALIGVISRYAVKFLKEKGIIAKLEKNKAFVGVVVNAVEQTYKTLHGEEKLNMAKIELVKLMSEKKIKISEKEIDLLIESAVKEMNSTIKKEVKLDKK